MPGLPLIVTGTIVSAADIIGMETDSWSLLLDRVRIKEDSSNIPFLKTWLDTFKGINSRALGNYLESNIENYSNPNPLFRTYFIDDTMRISRDQDDNIFIYVRD